eukprot:TRINITY_DN2855_c1_g3_i2.p1 TRINITY_DN2855_c1_g3~~TRINITY_DN2855_c1_g3_i2.p1  ORF type:complete len:499 (+),score=42.19 TRINITY_DN2855_c1_g3_i2:37-1533(+)
METPKRQIIVNSVSPEGSNRSDIRGKSNLVFGRNKDAVQEWLEAMQAKGSPASGLAFSTPGWESYVGSPTRFLSSPVTPAREPREEYCEEQEIPVESTDMRGRPRNPIESVEKVEMQPENFDVENMPPSDLAEQQMMLQMVRRSTNQHTDRKRIDAHMHTPRMQREALRGEKGLENPVGHNNCFLNVILQTLWHLRYFRESFLDDHELHTCTDQLAPDTCLYCAIHNLFTQYRFSQHKQLPPHLIRQVLHNTFNSEGRFQMGDMEDVCECLEAILFRLHLTANDKMDYCSPPCFVHKTFSLNIMEKHECFTETCSKIYEPIIYTATVQYFPSALFIKCPQHNHSKCRSLESCMRWHLKGKPRACEGCGKAAPLHPFLLGAPQHYSLGIAWDRNSADEYLPQSDLKKFVSNIPDTLNLSDVYLIPGYVPTPKMLATETGKVVSYSLSSIIIFYGRHYTCYCLHDCHSWLYFDDTRVTKVGTLDDVRHLIVARRQQVCKC